MSKKIMKTITLIVFLVIISFSGKSKVKATDYDVVCSYAGNINVYIKTKGQTEVSAKVGRKSVTIRNWLNEVGNFGGYKYFYDDNEYVCPPSVFYLVHNDYDYANTTLRYIYFYGDSPSESAYESDATAEFKKVDGSKHGVECGVTGPKKTFGGIKYETSCNEYKLQNQDGPNMDPEDPDPTPDPTECEENPEACEDPSVNSGIIKPISPTGTSTYSCGNEMMTGINSNILKATSYSYNILRIIVPLALIILGSMDLIKGIMAQKEDEIKKGQQIFIKRLVAAILIFFVFAIVKFLLGIFASSNSADIVDCLNCIIDGENSSSCVKES